MLAAPSVPAFVDVAPRLARTENGKIDRVGLRDASTRRTTAAEQVAASSEVHDPPADTNLRQIVRATWTEVLGRDVLDNRSFFDHGGTSILVISLYRKLRARLAHYRFEVPDLFRCPTIDSFVRFLQLDEAADADLAATARTAARRRAILAEVAAGRLSVGDALSRLDTG
ncbi:fengycin family lipopeptide synthetase D [Branchiibius hedensis]|uniref:Phosphopantetheine attachment site n=1 Tax=Branchiibius hedensis TaxID=672460 RepID=A0A2Y9BLL0_9MICO|nr:fengycin family lipopeptide synthetase D [Branchiibius hedensis]SSA59017.1 Phosphopantetheine attachment site [Branchiibius hedensis]